MSMATAPTLDLSNTTADVPDARFSFLPELLNFMYTSTFGFIFQRLMIDVRFYDTQLYTVLIFSEILIH